MNSVDSKPMLSLLDYIKLHRDSDCCWDCSDAVVTVDCSVDRDGKIDICDNEDTHMPRSQIVVE